MCSLIANWQLITYKHYVDNLLKTMLTFGIVCGLFLAKIKL